MKKLVMIGLTILFVIGAAPLVQADKGSKGKFEGKAGNKIYVCACGASCNCGTIGLKEGECSCGKKLAETSVTKVDKGRVYYQLEGKELSAPVQGKYMCGCGEGCDCGFISQKPGKCGCGKDMVKVKT